MKKLLLTFAAVLGLGLSASAETVTFDFTSDAYGLPNDAATYVTPGTTISSDGVDVKLDGSNGWRMWSDGLRVYYKNSPTMTITATGNAAITSIEWTANNGVKFATSSTGDAITEWTGNSTSVTLYGNVGSGNAALKTLTVTYGEGGTTDPDPGPGTDPDDPVDPTPGEGDVTATFNASAQGYSNAQVVNSATADDIEFTFSKASGSTEPTYYTTGSALRLYGGNTMTIAAPEGSNITKIEFTFDSGETANKTMTANVGSYENNTWTGSANSVTFTVDGTSGHKRIKTITVTYTIGEAPAVAAPKISCTDNTVTITCETADANIYYTIDGTEPTSASNAYTEPFTISETVTVKAIAYVGTAASSVATYTATYFGTYAGFADFVAEGSGVEGTIDGPITAVYQNGQYFYVVDSKAYPMLIYGNLGATYNNGDQFENVYGKYSPYQNLPELTNAKLGTVTTGGTPIEPSLIKADALTADMVNKYVKLEKMTLSSSTEMSDATGSVTLYNRFTGITIPTNYTPTYTVTGFVSIYNTTIQLYPVEFIEEVAEPAYELVGTYDMYVQATTLEAAKTAPVEKIQIEVYADGDNYYMTELGETNYFNGQNINFTYNSGTGLATFTAYYAGVFNDQPTWLAAFVGNGMTEPQENYALPFSAENGFTPNDNSGLAWFVTSGETTFDAMNVYSAFYIVNEPVEEPALPIYILGSGEGLTWDVFPGMKVEPLEDGSYSFTIANLSGFKMSTAEATGWDGEGGFNESAFGYDGTFGDEVFSANGMTVEIGAYGENQDMPYAGSYTITINKERTSMNVKANFAKPTAAPEVYIRGGMNSWGSGADWKFTNTAWDGNSGTFTWTGQINAGIEFKIADANWGAVNYTTNGDVPFNQEVTLVYNGGNTKLSNPFNGTITLTISDYTGHTATAFFAAEGTVTYPETMYVLGNVNGKGISPDNGVEMTVVDSEKGLYTITNLLVGNEMESGYGYITFASALGQNASDWTAVNAFRVGPATADLEIVAETAEYEVVMTDYNSFKVAADNYLTLTLDVKNMKLTVNEMTSEEPEQPEQPENIDVTFDFSAYENIQSYVPGMTGTMEQEWTKSSTGYTYTFKSLTNEGIVITSEKGSYTGSQGTSAYINYIKNSGSMTLRTYKGNLVTIAAPEGYTIKSIVFGGTSAGYVNAYALEEGQPGSVAANPADNKFWVWTAPEEGTVNSVTFNTNSGTSIVKTLQVVAEKVASEEPGDDNNEYEGAIEGVYEQTMNDETKQYAYTFNYNIVYNEDETLTVDGKFTWADGAPVGAENFKYFTVTDNGEEKVSDGESLTTKATYTKGQEITIHVKLPVALGAVEFDINYTVGTSGVNDVVVDENATARFFNLQGVEVAHPAAGNVYIKVVGNTVTKVLVK